MPAVAPGDTATTDGFAGAGESLALAAWYLRHRRAVVFLARDVLSAAHAVEELAFFAPEVPVRLFPDWGGLPYDRYSPPAELQAERMAALSEMSYAPAITIAPIIAAMSPCPPPSYVAARALNLKQGQKLNRESFTAALAACGYARVDRVLAAGEFAAYGGQIDVFPPGEQTPFRLVLADDEIEQLRIFDPRTQLSAGKCDEIRLSPAGECDLSEEGIARFRAGFKSRFDETDDSMMEDINDGREPPGAVFMLPLFFGGVSRLLDYASPETLIVMHDECEDAAARFFQQAERRQRHTEVYERRATLPAAEVFLSPAGLLESLKTFSVLRLQKTAAMPSPPPAAVNRRRSDSHAPLKSFLRETNGRVIIAADGEGRRDSLRHALSDENVETADSFSDCGDGISLTVAPLRGGFVADGLTVLTEAEIFDVRLPPRRTRRRVAEFSGELTPGDIVVHRDYGVGCYAGISEKTVGGEHGEFLCVRYADEQSLWLPVAHLHLLSPYYGEPPALSKLGGRQWKRQRARAEKAARDTAARMLGVHARRAASSGFSHCPDESDMARFAGGFRHEETPDQSSAVSAVLNDMRAPRPMDRLLVADVGFGKTEVAMRAACSAALSGMQTAILAPTTLLAEQHARNFVERFAGFPVQVVSLTRLSGAAEKKQTLAAIADGSADIAIGTHALLQSSVRFCRLGLAVIDEEHRFGVRHKEYFKSLRANIDVLALSATPIPRTMALGLSGVRDISIMATPPPARLAARSVVAPFSQDLIVDACERELLRGGQIYFVHNEIRGLPALAEQLREWLPSMSIVVAHGGMGALEIERAMSRFVRGGVDMLLATTIVESGLDITNANTMIINRADRMGVSRLHQLRGRVGRAGAQAYAYFLTPPEDAMSAKGGARMSAIADYSALGDGWQIAMRDLETRGAGEILGERQSGEIAAVGYTSYQKMVAAAARQMSGDEEPADIDAVVELSSPALLPSVYVPSAPERLHYYRRLSACISEDEIDTVRMEWNDRFGMPPLPAKTLILCHKLRLLAGAVQAARLRVREGVATVEFAENPVCHTELMAHIAADKCRPGKDGNTILIDNLGEDVTESAAHIADFLRALRPTHSESETKP